MYLPVRRVVARKSERKERRVIKRKERQVDEAMWVRWRKGNGDLFS